MNWKLRVRPMNELVGALRVLEESIGGLGLRAACV